MLLFGTLTQGWVNRKKNVCGSRPPPKNIKNNNNNNSKTRQYTKRLPRC